MGRDTVRTTPGAPPGAAPAAAEAISAAEDSLRGRLRWRCMRRGLLELDLMFDRFLTRHFESMDAAQLGPLDQLLDFEDTQLWAILSGREECPEERLKGLIELLRRT